MEIIREAFAKFGKPEIVNSDQGCQLSMDGKGAWRVSAYGAA